MPTRLTDEQRVRAAVPDASCWSHGSWRDGEQMWKVYDTSYVHEGSFPMSIGYSFEEAWNNALQHPTIQAHERTHGNAEPREHIEMGGKGSADTGVIPSKSEHMADTPELPPRTGLRHCCESTIAALRAERAEADGMDEATEARWQKAIYDLLVKECPDLDIDGGGTDSGDALDFTLSEVSQGIAHWKELATKPAPLTGPAMEAMVRACAEAVWQMYRKPHNLTENALKERTFEAIAAVVVETQGALLVENRELRAERDEFERKGKELCHAYGTALIRIGDLERDPLMKVRELGLAITRKGWVNARAEAAEAKVRDLGAAAGAARAEGIETAVWRVDEEKPFNSGGGYWVPKRRHLTEVRALEDMNAVDIENDIWEFTSNARVVKVITHEAVIAERVASEPKGASK